MSLEWAWYEWCPLRLELSRHRQDRAKTEGKDGHLLAKVRQSKQINSLHRASSLQHCKETVIWLLSGWVCGVLSWDTPSKMEHFHSWGFYEWVSFDPSFLWLCMIRDGEVNTRFLPWTSEPLFLVHLTSVSENQRLASKEQTGIPQGSGVWTTQNQCATEWSRQLEGLPSGY